jgi:hypothetical protein
MLPTLEKRKDNVFNDLKVFNNKNPTKIASFTNKVSMQVDSAK